MFFYGCVQDSVKTLATFNQQSYLFNPFRDSELELSNEATVLQSGEALWR